MPEPKLTFLKNGTLGYKVAYKSKVYPQGANNFYWVPPRTTGLAPDFYKTFYPYSSQLYSPGDFTRLLTPP
jgi:hypothetical protein